MTMEIFIMLFTLYASATGLVTEGVKKILDEAEKTYSSNLLALIIAIAIGAVGTLIYYQLVGVPFTVNNIICAVLLGFMSGIGAMVGYDKVTSELFGQLGNKKDKE